MEGSGPVGVFGFSRALNLTARVTAPDLYCSANGATASDQPKYVGSSHQSPSSASFVEVAEEAPLDLNCLLFDCRDGRHIIKTLGSIHTFFQRTGRRVNLSFHVFEQQAPLIARTLLILWLFMREDDVSTLEKSQQILELLGNTFIRRRTADLLETLIPTLTRIVTDGCGPLSSHFDFSWLKFRERDDIEAVLKFWRGDGRSYDIAQLRDFRLRRYYGVRYDTRADAVDWDYHMKLREKAPIIHKSEFLRWRLHGIAFEVRESEYDVPNRTTATVSLLKQDGLKVSKWGYFSDIVTGPFLPFGVETDNAELLKTANDVHKHTSGEIAEYNVSEFIKNYHASKSGSIPPLAGLNITFLPCEPSQAVARLAKSGRKMHKIFVSSSFAHLIEDLLDPCLLADNINQGESGPSSATGSDSILDTEVIVETGKYLLDLNKEQTTAFRRKVCDLATQRDRFELYPSGNGNPDVIVAKDVDFLVFRTKRKSQGQPEHSEVTLQYSP
ncbi:hypothetical protein DFJ73DRAFT_41600 [Zopfochytrium polystomum]|nr:hypothetical protein DFJ73DRAFT_41600 [Zopfochytrium polystomum]